MLKAKYLGIWMDHASAHLTEFTTDTMESLTIASTFTESEKVESLAKSEHIMHNKEQHRQSEYYKKIGESVLKYEEVLLFGPTNAKVELYNLLKADHHFDKIKIVVKQADKMTDNQQHAFIREHFSAERLE